MTADRNFAHSPLSLADLERIESTSLSSLERHHLRLIAHCLECFKAMGQASTTGSLPTEKERFAWCMAQPSLASDRAFVSVLLEQFAVACRYLEKVAEKFNLTPLELTLDHLIDSAISPANG